MLLTCQSVKEACNDKLHHLATINTWLYVLKRNYGALDKEVVT